MATHTDSVIMLAGPRSKAGAELLPGVDEIIEWCGVGWIGGISDDEPGSLLDLRYRISGDPPEPERALALAEAAGFDLPAAIVRELVSHGHRVVVTEAPEDRHPCLESISPRQLVSAEAELTQGGHGRRRTGGAS